VSEAAPPPSRGVLDTSTVILLPRLPDAAGLPAEPLIATVTLAELAVGPLVAADEDERARRQAHLNTLLRSLLAAVIVRPAGKGRRVPVEDRARVVVYGTELPLPANRAHLANDIVPVFPDAYDVGVLSVPPTEDALETASGAV
jgi:hypothetical protein